MPCRSVPLVALTVDEKIERILAGFIGDDAGRSVAVALIKGGKARFGSAESIPRPAASLLKVPIAMALYDASCEGIVNLETKVKRDDLAETAFPSVLRAFSPRHDFSLRELAELSLITSDNGAASHLVEVLGVDRINQWLKSKGLSRTHICSGFADSEFAEVGRRNVTTAGEILDLFIRATREERYAEVSNCLRNSIRKFRIPARIPRRYRCDEQDSQLIRSRE